MTAIGRFQTTGQLNLRLTPDLNGAIFRQVVPTTTLDAVLTSDSVVIEDGYRWRLVASPAPYTGTWFAECRVTNDGKPFGQPLARIVDIIITDDPAPPPDTDVRPTPEKLYDDGIWSWHTMNFTQSHEWLVEIDLWGEHGQYNLVVITNSDGFKDPKMECTHQHTAMGFTKP